MRSGDVICDTALYYPFRTICAGGKAADEAKESFEKIGDALEKRGIIFDLVDEEYIMSKKKRLNIKIFMFLVVHLKKMRLWKNFQSILKMPSLRFCAKALFVRGASPAEMTGYILSQMKAVKQGKQA